MTTWSDRTTSGRQKLCTTTGARTKCICVVMFAGAHEAISLVVQCQISVVDSSLSLDCSCYGSPPLIFYIHVHP